MNQRQLNYFLEVYHQKSISHAAALLYISPQALSKTITTLEAELGVTLFLRKSNGIIPTKAATSLVTHADILLQEYDIIENKLFKELDTIKMLPISCSYDVPQMMNTEFFYQFYDSNPNIHLKLTEYPDSEIIQQLEKNEIELGILPGNINSQKFTIVPLFSDSFCLIVNKKHPLAQKESITFTDLQYEPIVAKDLHSSISERQRDVFMQYGITPNVLFETSDSHLLYRMVEQNFAVCITLTQLTKNISSDLLKVIPFPNKWVRKQLYLTYRNDYVLSKNAETLKNSLINYYKAL